MRNYGRIVLHSRHTDCFGKRTDRCSRHWWRHTSNWTGDLRIKKKDKPVLWITSDELIAAEKHWIPIRALGVNPWKGCYQENRKMYHRKGWRALGGGAFPHAVNISDWGREVLAQLPKETKEQEEINLIQLCFWAEKIKWFSDRVHS